MDGNGRWATHRGLPRVAGHHEGVKAVRSIVRAASSLGLRYLTLYAFSTENWSRPPDEVSMLMSLLERSVNAELPELMARNARLRVLGRTLGLPSGVGLDGSGATVAGMGVDFEDYNNDGWPDVIITDLANQKYALYANAGAGSFERGR